MAQFFLFLMSWFTALHLNANTDPMVTVTIPQSEWDRYRQTQGVGGAGIGGASGCFQGMLQQTSQGIERTLAAQNSEIQGLLGVSKNYMDMEQQCGNDLAEVRLELDQARTEHEDKLLELPYEIEDQKLQYREALLALNQECEQSSGAVFQEWKQMVGTGVVTPERGGPMALFSRGRNINSFQKIFEMDCLGSKNNVERAHILAQRLANNIAKLQNGVDRSAVRLASLSKSLSFKQGMIVENCQRAEAQLDYQAELTRQMSAATNSATRSQNFIGMLSGVSQCISGLEKSIDVTNSGTGSDASN